jgi:hypothetical protein
MSRVFLVTSYGFAEVTLTSPVDLPGYIMDTLEPVSKMRCLAIPTISTKLWVRLTPTKQEQNTFYSVVIGGEVDETVFVRTCN